MKSKTNISAAVFCVLLMLITGASDALKGVFLPQFKSSFSLSGSQSSRIIMMCYVGNLLFLFIGGYFADRLPRKRFVGAVMLMWMSSLAAYVFTENYAVLLVAMIFSMGASTMLSTSVNLITPLIFAAPAFYVNIFNFCQGAGITASQNLGGHFADRLSGWHAANAILLALAAVCFVLLMTLKLPDPDPSAADKSPVSSYKSVLKNPACILLILLCGFYNVSEHGLQNWLTSYGSEYLGFTVSRSALFLSLFFGGITIGRLIFAPVVQRLGVFRSMLVFTTISALLYSFGILLERKGVYLICISGLAFSIIYPTMVLLIGRFFDPNVSGAATGFIIGMSNIFDIAFNACFGGLVQKTGYAFSIKLLPVFMTLFAVVLYILRFAIPRSKEIKA